MDDFQPLIINHYTSQAYLARAVRSALPDDEDLTPDEWCAPLPLFRPIQLTNPGGESVP
jgi:hypothetical protein